MSKESLATLNLRTLIGFTEKRSTAWHYRKEEQGTESNHYTGAIPVEDVLRRLFDWEAVSGAVTATVISPDGVLVTQADTFQAIMHSRTGKVFSIPSSKYQIHQYETWLLENVGRILDADLHIGSAGLLREGGQAWVQIEMEDTMTAGAPGSEPVAFRPFLTAATSHDGTLATTYLQGCQVVVCDNTLSAALQTRQDKVKVRHSSRSLTRIDDVRQGLNLVFETGEAFAAEVNALTAAFVSDNQWAEFVERLTFPGSTPSVRSKTMADSKRGDLNRLWNHDDRVAPWRNSKYGVVAAVNTYTHHLQTVKGASRADRNASRVVTGGVDKLDNSTLELLAKVID